MSRRERRPETEIRRRFDSLAGSYDRRWPRYIASTTRETLTRIDLTGARAVLDVGCGTGVLLESIGRELPAARLVGVDLSPGMLAVARRALGSRASLAVGDSARLPFRSRSFDLVLSLSSLHHWRDPEDALIEAHRVLRPSGRMAITDWCGDFLIDRLRGWVRRWLEPGHLRVYRSLDLEAMLARAGFRDIRVERWRLGWRWGLMTTVATRPGDSRSSVSAAPP